MNQNDKKTIKKGLFIGLTVGILVVVIAAVGLLIYIDGTKEKFEAYHKELSGYGLHSSLSAPGDAVTICFDGEKSNHGNFKGTIAIIKDGEVLVEYQNCRIEKHEDGNYFVMKHLDWTPDSNHPKPNDTVFRMMVDEGWDKVLLMPVFNEEVTYAALVAPAANHEAAVALFEELY
jgi:hypothetical protein